MLQNKNLFEHVHETAIIPSTTSQDSGLVVKRETHLFSHATRSGEVYYWVEKRVAERYYQTWVDVN